MSCTLAVNAMVAAPSLASTEKVLNVSLARTKADLTGAFQLVYSSYLQAGLVQPNEHEMRLTQYHLLPTTEVVVAKVRGQVVSTLSMVADSHLGLPMESMYPQQIAALRARSLRVAEMGSLADRRNSPVRFASTFAELARLVAQVAESRGLDALVLAAHPRHAKLYTRALGFEQIGDLTSCPYAEGNPAVALLLDFSRVYGTDAHKHLFSEAIPQQDLESTRWPVETVDYFRGIYQQQSLQSPTLELVGA